MSETMIERVARAIYEGRCGRGCKHWRRLLASHRAPYFADARAAIEAMRKPSKDMIADGLYAIQSHMDSTTDSIASYDIAVDGTAYHGWVAMIDAALSESSN